MRRIDLSKKLIKEIPKEMVDSSVICESYSDHSNANTLTDLYEKIEIQGQTLFENGVAISKLNNEVGNLKKSLAIAIKCLQSIKEDNPVLSSNATEARKALNKIGELE